jgi:NAD(P)-dependent dehydrogenase (short-subunit alcohol dehydrogenase family)
LRFHETRLTSVRIYLACTVRGDRGGVAAGRAICERLRHHGHDVITAHLLDDNVETAESQLTEDAVFRRDLEWLSTCDALVAEASGSSFGVGFEVGYVLARSDRTGQRVMLLYDRARAGHVSRLLVGNVHPACTTVAYDSVDELVALIDQRFARP